MRNERYLAWYRSRPKPMIQVEHWVKIRAAVIERDGHVCRICGSDPVAARLEVHHVDYDRTNNRAHNLVTLCSDCHRAIHAQGYMPDGEYPEPWSERGDRDAELTIGN